MEISRGREGSAKITKIQIYIRYIYIFPYFYWVSSGRIFARKARKDSVRCAKIQTVGGYL